MLKRFFITDPHDTKACTLIQMLVLAYGLLGLTLLTDRFEGYVALLLFLFTIAPVYFMFFISRAFTCWAIRDSY